MAGYPANWNLISGASLAVAPSGACLPRKGRHGV